MCMKPITYVVRVIIPDGKNKTVAEEEYVGTIYLVDEITHDLIIRNNGAEVIQIHNYNWLSIRPKS